MQLRVVFFGSPEFSLPALEALHSRFGLAGVVTQPDRPAGRGRQLTPPPVKAFAESSGIPFIQPEKLRAKDVFAQIASWQPDLIIVAAYGQILRQNILDLPRFGCLNIHPSLLPRWRGASPFPFALLAGDSVTGVTIMKMDAGMDTGPILCQEEYSILPEDNAGTLHDSLANKGADLLIRTIPGYISGQIEPKPQDDSAATYSRLITKQDGALDFQNTCKDLANRVRAFTPWPGAYFSWKGAPLKVLQAHSLAEIDSVPGVRKVIDGLPAVGAQDGWLLIDVLQPAGKRPMPGSDFLRGVKDWV